MYHEPHLTWVTVDSLTETLCGASRPGHFRGVTTVCAKLFLAVKPHFAVFGSKDFQQAQIIKRMVTDLNFDLKIMLGKIIREPDGLAMSSRNVYLSSGERAEALVLSESLKLAEGLIRKGERNTETVRRAIESLIQSKPDTRIDYVSIADPETLRPVRHLGKKTLIALAVFVGKTRLIDNTVIRI